MPLPSLYVNPEDKINSEELAKQIAEEIKATQAEQEVPGGAGGGAPSQEAVQVEIDAPDAEEVEDASIDLLGQIAENTYTSANMLKGMSPQMYSMHMDAMRQRKNENNHALLEEIRDAVVQTAEKEEEKPEEPDAEREEEETNTGVPENPNQEDPNDAAQSNNEEASEKGEEAKGGQKKQGIFGKMMANMLGGLSKMFQGMLKGFKKFFKIFAIGLAVLAAAALMVTSQGVELFRMMREGFNLLVDLLTPVVEILMDVFGKLLEVVLGLANTLMPIITSFLTQLMPIISSVMDSLARMFMMIVDMLAPIISSLVNTVMPALRPLMDVLLFLFEMIVDTVTNVLKPVFVVLGTALGLVANVIGFIASIAMAVVSLFTEGPAVAFNMLKNAGDFIVAGIADLINGIIDFVAGVVDAIPGPNFGLADKIRSMKVEFGDKARERIAQRNAESDGTIAKEMEESGAIDFGLSQSEFEKVVADKVEAGEISNVVGNQLVARKLELDQEQDAFSKTSDAEPAEGVDIAAMIAESMGEQQQETAERAATMEEELAKGRGEVLQTENVVVGPQVQSSVGVNEKSTEASESQKDTQTTSSQTTVSAPTMNSSTVVSNKSTTSFGTSSGSNSLGHRHRRVLPGIA